MDERDTRSYTERYASPAEPPPPPPPSSRSTMPVFLALLGVGLLSATLVTALVLRPGSGTPAATTASATHTTTPLVSSGPTPSPEPGALALQRFWSLIGDAKLSYHLETTGGGLIASEAYTFRESLDVAGDSWKGSEQAHGLGYVSAVQLVVLDADVWIKVPGGSWGKHILHDPFWRARPLLDLDSIRDLTPSGTVVKDGHTLYDLKANTNYQPYPGRLIGFASMGIRVDSIELDILVTADGIPVEAKVHVLAGGLGSNGKPEFDAKATRTFTKVGATFSITAPKP